MHILKGICRFDGLNLLPCRGISKIPPGAERVIVFAFPYRTENGEKSNISKYALVRDYHNVVGEYLRKEVASLEERYPGEVFVPFCDNSPIPEVTAACLAGLGVRGRNGLLITPEYGSFVFIGEIVTTLALPCETREIKGCIACGKCEKVCPTGCIESGDMQRCFSAMNQKKGELTEECSRLIKETGCVWGCDICQDICPMNKDREFTDIPEFLTSQIPMATAGMDLTDRAFAWRGRKVIERNILNEYQ